MEGGVKFKRALVKKARRACVRGKCPRQMSELCVRGMEKAWNIGCMTGRETGERRASLPAPVMMAAYYVPE